MRRFLVIVPIVAAITIIVPPPVKRREDREDGPIADGHGSGSKSRLLALALGRFLAGFVIIGAAVIADETVDFVFFVDGDPLELHLRVVGQVVDEELLRFPHHPDAGVFVAEGDDV